MIGTILCLLLLPTTFCEGSFYISQDISKWSEQNRNCNPVTPEVRAAVDTDYQVSERLGINLPQNERVWVGYYQVDRVFEYIGCVSMQNLFNNTEHPFIEIKGDPGHCFPGCGAVTVIGVTRNMCYCLRSDFKEQYRTEIKCTEICDGLDVACGKEDRPIHYSYLSIYKVNTNVTASTIAGATEKMNCLTLEPTVPKRFSRDQCTTLLPPMCAYGDYVLTPTDGKEHFSWTGAANVCFRNSIFPTNYSNSKLVDRRNGWRLWTGMFITSVVYRHDAKIPANQRHDPRKFGFLIRDSDNNVKLQFTDIDSNKRRLCEDGSTTKSSTQNLVTTLSSKDPSTTLADVRDTPTKSSFDTYVILGICLSVVLISVVIVLLVFFIMRRNKNRPLKQGNKMNQASGYGKNDTEIPAHNSSQGSNNYILEPIENQNDNRTTENYDISTEDNIFDIKKDTPDYSETDAGNVYNQLDNETTYDHAISNIERSRSKSSENEMMDETYDKCIVTTKINCDVRRKDNIYNESGGIEEDEYNHLRSQVKKLKSDNVYGVQGEPDQRMDNEYDMSISRHCKYNEQTDNTYSCLPDKIKIEI